MCVRNNMKPQNQHYTIMPYLVYYVIVYLHVYMLCSSILINVVPRTYMITRKVGVNNIHT